MFIFDVHYYYIWCWWFDIEYVIIWIKVFPYFEYVLSLFDVLLLFNFRSSGVGAMGGCL